MPKSSMPATPRPQQITPIRSTRSARKSKPGAVIVAKIAPVRKSTLCHGSLSASGAHELATSNLQSGQLPERASQVRRQAAWKACWHRSCSASSPLLMHSKQMLQLSSASVASHVDSKEPSTAGVSGGGASLSALSNSRTSWRAARSSRAPTCPRASRSSRRAWGLPRDALVTRAARTARRTATAPSISSALA
eukprot:scaffold76191_cov63-Phaeocystis_antarctica.AAC.2